MYLIIRKYFFGVVIGHSGGYNANIGIIDFNFIFRKSFNKFFQRLLAFFYLYATNACAVRNHDIFFGVKGKTGFVFVFCLIGDSNN